MHSFLHEGGRRILRSLGFRHAAWFNSGYTLTRRSTESWLRVKLEGILAAFCDIFSASVHPDVEAQVAGTPGV